MTIAIPAVDIWRGKKFTDDELPDKALAEVFGWESLRTLMGGSLAISPATVRPNQAGCSGGTYYVAPVGAPGILDPYVGIDGRWYNSGLGHRPDGCHCGNARRIRLPGPIGRVEFVSVGGVVVPSTAYQVLDNEWLVRTDGGLWPRHQDMYAGPDEPGAFVVRYFIGSAPDELDAFAAGVLAKEMFALLKTGDQTKCRLPRSATSVTRQGVSYDLSTSGFTDGKSGIPEVDAIVSRRNPHLLKVPSLVMSIDTMDRGVVTQGVGLIAPTPPGGAAGGARLVPDPLHPGYYTLQEA